MSLDTTVGGVDAESYITLEESDNLVTQLPDDPSEWLSLYPEDKEYRLFLAAQAMRFMKWKGRKDSLDQALSFPRTVQSDTTKIPEEIKLAQMFLAYSLIHRGLESRQDMTDKTVSSEGPRTLSQLTLKSLSIAFASAESQTTGESGTSLQDMISNVQFPVMLGASKYLAQFRGWVVDPIE